MPAATEQDFLAQAFAGRGIALHAVQEWLVHDGQFPAIRAIWQQDEGARVGRLDVTLVLSENQRIEECFAGLGADAIGRADALRSFVSGAFHVLLAAIWNRLDAQQVQVEEWMLGSRQWTAYLGNLTIRNFGQPAVLAPPGIPETIAAALSGERLDPGYHWVRLLYCNSGTDRPKLEVLLDNQPWQSGIDAIGALPWTISSELYIARVFLMLKQTAN